MSASCAFTIRGVHGVQGQRQHGQPSVLQGAGHLQAGGAAVEDDGLAVGDQLGSLGGDAPLGLQPILGPQREGRLLAAQQQAPGSPSIALEHPLCDQDFQVATVLRGTFAA
jgi:hypothetical protein